MRAQPREPRFCHKRPGNQAGVFRAADPVGKAVEARRWRPNNLPDSESTVPTTSIKSEAKDVLALPAAASTQPCTELWREYGNNGRV
jgi:hypothetical protein